MPGRVRYLPLVSAFLFYFQNLLSFVVEIKAVLRCFSRSIAFGLDQIAFAVNKIDLIAHPNNIVLAGITWRFTGQTQTTKVMNALDDNHLNRPCRYRSSIKNVMNQTHIHLMITHLPIIGAALGALVLIHGIWNKSNTTLIAAYNLLIISAIGAGIAYATGEGAEETVEHLQGISKNVIEEHAESALISLISLMIMGGIALIGLIVTMKRTALIRPVALIALTASLVGFGLIARTAYLGGQIRHTEIGTGTASPVKEGNGKDND